MKTQYLSLDKNKLNIKKNKLIKLLKYFKQIIMNKKTFSAGTINMAFGAGSETTEAVSFDKYTGIAPFFVKGVNMSKDEMKALYPDRNYEKEFSYDYMDNGERKGTFVTFQVASNTDHKDTKGVLITNRVSILVGNDIYWNRDRSKFQAINKYGDTVWLTQEEFNSKTMPEYAKANSLDGLRPAFSGESELVDFLRCYINIPGSKNYSKEEGWTMKEPAELAKAECGFSQDEIMKIAKGDVTPIKQALKIQPNNQIKLLCGVRTTDDGRDFQEICNRIFVKFGTSNYAYVKKTLNSLVENGSFANSNFGEFPFEFKKHEVTMTSFSSSEAPSSTPNPFEGFGA